MAGQWEKEQLKWTWYDNENNNNDENGSANSKDYGNDNSGDGYDVIQWSNDDVYKKTKNCNYVKILLTTWRTRNKIIDVKTSWFQKQFFTG